MYSVAKEPLGLSPLPSTSKSWQGSLRQIPLVGREKVAVTRQTYNTWQVKSPGFPLLPQGLKPACLFLRLEDKGTGPIRPSKTDLRRWEL